MGHSDIDWDNDRNHGHEDLSADDSPWSDDVWSEDDEGSLLFEDSDEGSESNEPEAMEESDSSEGEVALRNTVGDVPLEWYKNEEHVGYDISGRKIKKRDREGRIEAYLRNSDDAKNW